MGEMSAHPGGAEVVFKIGGVGVVSYPRRCRSPTLYVVSLWLLRRPRTERSVWEDDLQFVFAFLQGDCKVTALHYLALRNLQSNDCSLQFIMYVVSASVTSTSNI